VHGSSADVVKARAVLETDKQAEAA
jgi:hypothetical protein